MHCHCCTNNRAPRWTFTDPCEPEVRPGAREESASPAWLAAPAMNARDTTKVYIWWLDTGCGPTLYDRLSLNFLGMFLSSFWICVQSRKKNWPRSVQIFCQKISAPRKSHEGWPLTLWPKIWDVARAFHLLLEYEVRSLYIENILSYCTRNNGLFLSHNDLHLKTSDLKLYVCLPVVM